MVTKKGAIFTTLLILTAFLYFGCADTSDETAESSGIVVGVGDIGSVTDGPGAVVDAPVEVLNDGLANLTMSFTDAPIDDAESVTVGIKKIEIKKGACGTVSENCDATGDPCEFVEYFSAADESEEQIIDLLEFRNGATFLFETKPLDVGEYCQFRFYLSEETGKNTITLIGDEETKELEINSGIRTSGLKLVSGFELVDGVPLNLTVDFDVRKSIVAKGGKKNPRYALKPTIRIIQTDLSGSITLGSDVVTAAGEVYYLYEQDFEDIDEEATTQDLDDEGVPFDSPYLNAVSSAVSDATLTAVFVAIPIGIYDVYAKDASTDSLNLIQEDIEVSAE